MDVEGGSGPAEAGADAGDRAPDAMPVLDGVEHRFVDLPGLRMHVAEAGTGEPLVMLHGFPQHWWAWRRVLPALVTRYRVICPDLRGAGWTDAPPTGYRAEQQVADVIALLDALGLDAVRLVGHDMGGIVGYRVCLAHPTRVRGFVCIAAPHPWARFSPRVLLHVWSLWPWFALATPGIGPRLLGGGSQRIPRAMFTGDAGGTNGPEVWSAQDVEQFVGRLRDPARARAGSALYRDLVLREGRRTAARVYRGSRLRAPTLGLYGALLFGSGDDPGPLLPEVLRGYEDHADDLTMTYVPGSGYYLAEEQPEVVADHMLRFFAAT